MKILTVLLAFVFFLPVSIYSFSVQGWNGAPISFDQYEGKKILLVNIATNSERVAQLGQLQQLQDLYSDSLVVIGFPSDSYGHEKRVDSVVHHFCDSAYGVTFPLAAKAGVTGNGCQPVYYWLTHDNENGAFSSDVREDFQKYLIDRDGRLVGVFAGSVSPLNTQLTHAITTTP